MSLPSAPFFSSPTASVCPSLGTQRGGPQPLTSLDLAIPTLALPTLAALLGEGQEQLYESLAGTSMAAPHVSGAVALSLAQGYTPVDAVQRLLNTADPKVQCGANSPTCHGRIDVAKAVAEHPPVPAGRTAPASPAPSPQ